MKSLMKGLMLVLAMVMCLNAASAFAEESLLSERMGQAYDAGRQVEVSLSVKMGHGLALFLPQETFDALSKLLADTRILARYAKDAEGSPAMGLNVYLGEVEVLTGSAVITEGGATVNTSLLQGLTVLVPLESLSGSAVEQALLVQIDEASAALLMQAYETYFGIVMGWVEENPGMMELVSGPIPGTDARSEADGGVKLAVPAETFKDLLVRLTQAFAQDVALQKALEDASDGADSMADVAKDLADLAQMIQPTDGALRLDAYSDSAGVLVGLDFEMEPLFQGIPGTAYIRYDRLDEDGRVAHDFQGRIGLPEGGQAAARVSYVAEESHLESKINTNLRLRGMYQGSGEEPISQVTLTDERETISDADQERMNDVISFTMETLAPDGSAPEEASMPLSAAIHTESTAAARAGDDFDADVTVSVQAFGMEFAALALNFASGDYTPVDASGNTVIDLATATPEVQDALMEALQTGLQLALATALQAAPPEVLAMLGA